MQRYWYEPVAKVGEKGKSICPLELRSGIIAGYFTPRAARQGAFAMAHLTAGESEALFGEIGNMQPSRSSLDRLTKALSPHWEAQRVSWEAQLRQTETVPVAAKVVVISVDGVMSPIRGADKQAQAQKAGKHASGPTGYKEVGCGTVTLYDQEAERLQTVRYARMPESKKVTLQQQLETEAASILALRPDLRRRSSGRWGQRQLASHERHRSPSAATVARAHRNRGLLSRLRSPQKWLRCRLGRKHAEKHGLLCSSENLAQRTR